MSAEERHAALLQSARRGKGAPCGDLLKKWVAAYDSACAKRCEQRAAVSPTCGGTLPEKEEDLADSFAAKWQSLLEPAVEPGPGQLEAAMKRARKLTEQLHARCGKAFGRRAAQLRAAKKSQLPEPDAELIWGADDGHETWLLGEGVGLHILPYGAASAAAVRKIVKTAALLTGCVWSLRLLTLRSPLVLGLSVGALHAIGFAVPPVPAEAQTVATSADESLARACIIPKSGFFGAGGHSTLPRVGLDGRLHARETWRLLPAGARPPKGFPLCVVPPPKDGDYSGVALRCIGEAMGVIEAGAHFDPAALSAQSPPHSARGPGGRSKSIRMSINPSSPTAPAKESGAFRGASFRGGDGAAAGQQTMSRRQSVAVLSGSPQPAPGMARQKSMRSPSGVPPPSQLATKKSMRKPPGGAPFAAEEPGPEASSAARALWYLAETRLDVSDTGRSSVDTHRLLMDSWGRWQVPIAQLGRAAAAAAEVGGPAETLRRCACTEMVARVLVSLARADILSLAEGDEAPNRSDSGRVDSLVRMAVFDDGGGFWGRTLAPAIMEKFNAEVGVTDVVPALLQSLLQTRLGIIMKDGRTKGLSTVLLMSSVPQSHSLPPLCTGADDIAQTAAQVAADSQSGPLGRAAAAVQWVVSTVERGIDPGHAAALLDALSPPAHQPLGPLGWTVPAHLAHLLSISEQVQGRNPRAQLQEVRAVEILAQASTGAFPEASRVPLSGYAVHQVAVTRAQCRAAALAGEVHEVDDLMQAGDALAQLFGDTAWAAVPLQPLLSALEENGTPAAAEVRIVRMDRWRGRKNPVLAELVTDSAFGAMDSADLPRAIAMFERALELTILKKPDDLSVYVAHNNLGIAQYEMGRGLAAAGTAVEKERQWRGMRRVVEEDCMAALRAAREHFGAIRAAEAELLGHDEEGQELLTNALNNAASVELQLGEWAAAECLFRQAMESASESAQDDRKRAMKNIKAMQNKRMLRATLVAQRGARKWLARREAKRLRRARDKHLYDRMEEEEREDRGRSLILQGEREAHARLLDVSIDLTSRAGWQRCKGVQHEEGAVWHKLHSAHLVGREESECRPQLLELAETEWGELMVRQVLAAENAGRETILRHQFRGIKREVFEFDNNSKLIVEAQERGARKATRTRREADFKEFTQVRDFLSQERDLRGELAAEWVCGAVGVQGELCASVERTERAALAAEQDAAAAEVLLAAERLGREAVEGTCAAAWQQLGVAAMRSWAVACARTPTPPQAPSAEADRPALPPSTGFEQRPPSAPRRSSTPLRAEPASPPAGGRHSWGPGSEEGEPRPRSAASGQQQQRPPSRPGSAAGAGASLADEFPLSPTQEQPTPQAPPRYLPAVAVLKMQRIARGWLSRQGLQRARGRGARHRLLDDHSERRAHLAAAELAEDEADARDALEALARLSLRSVWVLRPRPPLHPKQLRHTAAATAAAAVSHARGLLRAAAAAEANAQAAAGGSKDAAGAHCSAAACYLRLARLAAQSGDAERERGYAARAAHHAGAAATAQPSGVAHALHAAALNACACSCGAGGAAAAALLREAARRVPNAGHDALRATVAANARSLASDPKAPLRHAPPPAA